MSENENGETIKVMKQIKLLLIIIATEIAFFIGYFYSYVTDLLLILN